MLARYVQKGDSIDYRPTAAVAAGSVIVIADLVGVARLDIEAHTLGSLAVVGVLISSKLQVRFLPVPPSIGMPVQNRLLLFPAQIITSVKLLRNLPMVMKLSVFF